jgi:tetratricopeptide (TPR) repeat protein
MPSFRSKLHYSTALLICAVMLAYLLSAYPASALTQAGSLQTVSKKSCCTMLGLVPRIGNEKTGTNPEMAAYVNRTFAYLSAHDCINAFVEANAALKFNPHSAVAHYLDGAALLLLFDFSSAAGEFSESLKIDPSFADAHFMLGQAHRMSGSFEEALSDYQEALKLKPDFAAARALAGECYRMQGIFWKAKIECSEAMQLDPKLPLPHTILAETYLLQDKTEQCLAEYNAAVELAPDDPYVHFRYGQSLGALKRWSESEAELRKAMQLDPQYADAVLGLSGVLFGQERLADALSYSKKAVALAPNDVDTHRMLAQLYSINGQHDLSVSEFKIARGLKPGSLYIQRALALELARTQNLDEAIVELSLVIRQFPLDEDLKLAFNALLQLKDKERAGKSN